MTARDIAFDKVLVDQPCNKTLDLISLDALGSTDAQGGGEFYERHARAPDLFGGLLWVLGIAGFLEGRDNEDAPEEVAKGDFAGALECEIDAAMDKGIFASGEGGIEGREVATLDSVDERGEEGTETREAREERRFGDIVRRKQACGNEVGKNESSQG